MTVKSGIYAMFLLKMVVEGVYFKNPTATGATLAHWANFFIDVISHAHFFHIHLNYDLSSFWYKHIMFGIKLKLMANGM